MAELAPEEIEALIDRSEPLPPEFVTGRTPPVMDAPPVPLPLGTERRFFAQPPVPANPLEDIRKQINAVQFKTAQEALDAATQFQALRAYQRDLEAGKDPTRWLPLLFKKNPTVIPGMMREKRLSAPPGITNINGFDVLTGGGGSARVIPRREAEADITTRRDPTSGRLFQRRNGQWYPIDPTPRSGAAPLQRADEAIQRKTMLEAAEVLRTEARKKRPDAKLVEQATKDYQSSSNALFKLDPKVSAALPKPTSKAEFDNLPSGTRFIDPDGKERIKP